MFDAQYQLTLREEIQIRTYTDEDGDEHEYEYRILHVTLTSRSIASLAPELLTPEQMEMYQSTDRLWRISRCCLVAVLPIQVFLKI